MTNLQSDRTSQPSKGTVSPASSLERSSGHQAKRSGKLNRDRRQSSNSKKQVLTKKASQKQTRYAQASDRTDKVSLTKVGTEGRKSAVKVDILGMDFDNFSMQELLQALQRGILFTPNVDHLMKLRSDPEFAQVYEKADFKICDSQIVMYASKFLGKTLKEKLSGSDLFPLFCEHHKHNETIRIFLLGGREGIAKQAQARINQRVGREIVVGEYAPPFGFEQHPEECDRVIDYIHASEATVVAVCLGAPKQEKWIAAYSDRLPNVDIFMAVGAVVDFEAGAKPRAPKYVSELGLEWLYRLVCEPRRLWRRYLLEDMPFVWLVLAEKFKQVTATGR